MLKQQVLMKQCLPAVKLLKLLTLTSWQHRALNLTVLQRQQLHQILTKKQLQTHLLR